jgi:hypothetical protein
VTWAVITLRYFVFYSAANSQLVALVFLWPLTVFETAAILFMADRCSSRRSNGLCWTQLGNCSRVATVEGFSLLFALII